jgi:methanogenic corrinoid protein MtbC1
MENKLEIIREGIMDGDMHLVQDNVQAALDEGMPAPEILNEGLIKAMAEVGRSSRRASTSSPRC